VTQTINGTPGNDTLTGTDPGNPANTDGIDIINGLVGNDTLVGLGGNDILQGGAGADTLAGGDGSDTVSYAQSTAGVTVRLFYQPDAVGAGGDAQGDRYSGIENIIGSAFDDVLTGYVFLPNLPIGSSILDGGAGNDLLSGDGGADTLIGGAGIDTAYYDRSGGGVRVDLSAGTGTGGDAEGDTLTGIENLTGSNAGDTLIGDGGANVLDGGAGNDVLTGGAGDDRLVGRGGADQLQGGDGSDTAGYGVHVIAVQVNLATGTGSGAAQGDTFSSIENVNGTPVNDTLTGSAVANILAGGAGDDLLEGGAGADTLDGGDGIDTASYSGSAAAVTVDLRSGTGAGGDAQGDTLQNIENIIGSALADILQGSGAANAISGGAGNDLINGYAGNDVLNGGDGIDTVYYDGSAAGVQVDLAAGTGAGGDRATP
jgi:Ca2+-binding RTX toxin-like protein